MELDYKRPRIRQCGRDRKQADEVWGLVYYLSAQDELKLDRNEVVPYHYTKEILKADLWVVGTDNSDSSSDGTAQSASNSPIKGQDMLVYVDRERMKPSKPREEYIHRMNMGITDALKEGVPTSYINTVIRKYILLENVDKDKKKLAEQ